MRLMLFILAAIAFAVGAAVLSNAENAIHEMEAFILFVIAAVFVSGAAIVEAINLLRKELTEGKH